MNERRENKRNSNPQKRAFKYIALRWWKRQKESWSDDHAARVKRWITVDAKVHSEIAIDQIDAGHITDLMISIEEAGTPKKAPNILSVINRIFGYALAHRLTRTNPAQGLPLRDILKPLPKVKHRAAITCKKELALLINDIDTHESGSFCTVESLKLIPRLFLRPRKYVFPSERDSGKPISKNVMTNRLRTMGYSADVMSAHGFRSTASTLLHEQGWNHDVIEVQLAHLTGNSTSRAYNRSAYLAERKKMMQAWSDFLDGLSC